MCKLKALPVVAILTLASIQAAAQQPNTQPPPADAELTTIRNRLSRAEARLADWPQLKRYAEANAKLASPQKGEMRVVFMGDSITDSWSREDSGGFFPGKPYVNRGISGQTTPQMLVRFRPDVLDLKPKAVVILAGTNDIAGNTGPTTIKAISDNLASMAELATANNIRVVFASVLPVSDYNRHANGQPIIQTAQRPPAKILELNNWIKDYAARNGHTYLDYYAALVDARGMLRAEVADDGLHPNAKGYAIMSPLAEQAIDRALRGKK